MGSLFRSLAAECLALALAGPVAANEVGAVARPGGIRIHGAEETLRDYCVPDGDGVLWLQIPGGTRFELVTSPLDARVANPGDGAFHPFDEAEVRAALAEVRYPIGTLDVEIFILPAPRGAALESAAGPGVILLSPGVVPIPPERQHAEVVHELGHVVQYRWLPDGDPRWVDYRERRGITDERYSASAIHADRPHEIFAEDFRALFGGTLATYSGSIENASLAYPSLVPGLAEFLRSLPEGAAPRSLRLIGAHPAHGVVALARAGATEAALDLFDLAGRRVATVAPTIAGGETTWLWSGTGGAGGRVGAGVLLARVRGTAETARFTWIP